MPGFVQPLDQRERRFARDARIASGELLEHRRRPAFIVFAQREPQLEHRHVGRIGRERRG
jgi:hypothetical protein